MSNPQILASFSECLVDYARHFAESFDAPVKEWNGVLLCNPGLKDQFKNMVVMTRDLESGQLAELSDVITDFYGSREGWALWTLIDVDLEPFGYKRASPSNPVMARLLKEPIEQIHVDGLAVKEVKTAADVTNFERVREIARGRTFSTDSGVGGYLDMRAIGHSHRLWVGYLGGIPVVTGALFETDKVSMVKNIAVLPEFRGGGIGKAMSAHVANSANFIPVLDADDIAPAMYKKLGFDEIGTLHFWNQVNELDIESLKFRFAEFSDAESIRLLVESAYRGDSSKLGWTSEADLLGGQRTDVEAIREIISTDDSYILMAESNGELVGSFQLQKNDANTGYIGMFAVSPVLQGKGLGKTLITEGERIMREEFGCKEMIMTVIKQRSELIAWYERLGYKQTGETKPFPYGDERFGLPKVDDLEMLVLAKNL